MLSAAVVAALSYWPDYVPVPRQRVDISVLPPFFDGLLGELPWWNPAWRVVEVRHAWPCFTAVGSTRVVEVSVPGQVGGASPLPFSARVRFEGDRLVRFQAKVGDVVIGPAAAGAGEPEPDPFGVVIGKLIDARGLPDREVALRAGISRATVRALRRGWAPDPVIVARLAAALEVTPADLLAIAGLEGVAR
ncbi:hypothetical protein Air01nite_57730 [Asanoa iriomotensis]|uniref:HTH cro/C1-type domain-containing protein n=1 Tax=Asanoa iriomotensis TaxID=234613 RepID=A0ABQ4CA76_9ACTN|nr:hypothetical protein Air01nite_57730 [Asanoa iriomotensis]